MTKNENFISRIKKRILYLFWFTDFKIDKKLSKADNIKIAELCRDDLKNSTTFLYTGGIAFYIAGFTQNMQFFIVVGSIMFLIGLYQQSSIRDMNEQIISFLKNKN